jgi:hypothetical protein
VKREAATFKDKNGEWVRRCSRCKEVKNLVDGFYASKNKPDTFGEKIRQWHCKRCQIDQIGARVKERYKEPSEHERLKQQRRDWQANWRDKNREMSREYSRRHYYRVKADPEKWAIKLETARMDYRLRQMRLGKPARIRKTIAEAIIPANPFVDWLEQAIPSVENLHEYARNAGLTDRTIRRIMREGQAYVSVDTVDRLLMAHEKLVVVNGVPVFTLDDLYPNVRFDVSQARAAEVFGLVAA